MRRTAPLALLPLLALVAAACSGSKDECATTEDCLRAGKTGRSCVNGACVQLCEQDMDCVPPVEECADTDTACQMRKAREASSTEATFVCEDHACTKGCPDVACGPGERCFSGRCGFFFESFEAPKPGDPISLDTLPAPWDDIHRELRNTKPKIVYSGAAGCGPADDPDRCAGPAGDGVYFLAIERQPTPERGNLIYDSTCQACRCCLECRDASYRTTIESACLGMSLPPRTACADRPPPECNAACTACDACPNAAGRTPSPLLSACEATPATKYCAGCTAYDACLAMKGAEMRPCPGAYPACTTTPTVATACRACLIAECDHLRSDCWACRDAASLEADYPMEPDKWSAQAAACAQQGAHGCYAVPVDVQRSGLTEDEQSVESPAIDLGQASGSVVVELEYVPFNVGRTYFHVIQGQPRSTWKQEPEEVRVQLCSGGCEQPGGWVDATFTTGELASIPADDQRGNGLSFGAQSKADWSADHRVVVVPDAMRTSGFRVRFVPKLVDEARIGLDKIFVRRKP